MNLVKVKCIFCGREFFRGRGQFNEAKKFGWNQYCSRKCLSKDRTKKQVVICENCGKHLKRSPCTISPHNYCSSSCAIKINNKKRPKRKVELKICTRCGKQFKKSTGNKKYCSIKCRKQAEWYTPQKIMGIIKGTIQELGRVPARRELRGIDNACRRFFGSWNNTIIAAGFQPNRSHSQRMYKRTKTQASDGHLCDSVSEAIIDNWLSAHKILHQRNISYPETNHKADWAIFIRGRKVFIEYFGLANDSPRYDRAIRKKKELCHRHKLTLVAIYPQDIYPKRDMDRKLRDKFGNLINVDFGDSGLEPLISRTRGERLTN